MVTNSVNIATHKFTQRGLIYICAMNKSMLLTVGILYAIIVGCGVTQRTPPQSTDSVQRVVGGYSMTDLPDSTVTECAVFAVKRQDPSGSLRLVSITSAQRQVVAGTNYMINMVITRDGQTEIASATVWVKLDGTKELTAWESHR